MVDVVFKYSNETAFFNRLNALNIATRTGDNPEGGKYRKEDLLGDTTNGEWPLVDDVTGEMYVSARLSADDANKIPNNDQNPAFSIVWRSDEVDENGDLYPWPEVEVQAYDIDGNPSGTRMQGVGRII